MKVKKNDFDVDFTETVKTDKKIKMIKGAVTVYRLESDIEKEKAKGWSLVK